MAFLKALLNTEASVELWGTVTIPHLPTLTHSSEQAISMLLFSIWVPKWYRKLSLPYNSGIRIVSAYLCSTGIYISLITPFGPLIAIFSKVLRWGLVEVFKLVAKRSNSPWSLLIVRFSSKVRYFLASNSLIPSICFLFVPSPTS